MSATTLRLAAVLAVSALAPAHSQAQSQVQPQAQSQAQSQTPPIATIRARGGLVIVDVAVTESGHHPIHGLKPADFLLSEDGAPQKITHFEEHAAPPSSAPANPPPAPRLLPGYFTNYTPAPPGGTLNILLLDALNTPMRDQSYVRQQLLDYLRNAPAGAPVAIFGLTERLLLLQSFTSDPAVLKSAVLAKAGAQMSSLMDDPLNGTASESITDFMKAPGGGGGKASSALTSGIQQQEGEHTSLQLQQRALYTLAAMDQLARYLESIPGRKNLIWFSGSFPINLLPNSDLADPFSVVASAQEEYRETTNLLTRAQVAVYPIDARANITSTVHAASNPARSYAGNPHTFAHDQASFQQEIFAEHDTMVQMAQDTGGHAFVDTGGLAKSLAQAIDSGANYYTLTYTPTDADWNGKFRKIQVRLQPDAAHGVTLAYRRGYYADDPDAPAKSGRDSAAATAHAGAMTVAMMHGAPAPTEILMKVRILRAPGAESSLAEGNALNPDFAAETRGPYQRFLIDSESDLGGIQFTESADGHFHAEVEFVTFVFDSSGAIVNAIDTPIQTDLTRDRYLAILRTGLPYHQEISVPVKGEFFLRTAIHDTRTNRVGAIEVPVSAVAPH